MNKAELIAGVAADSKYSKKATEDTINALVGRVMKGLVDGEDVVIAGLGKFSVKSVPARTARNPIPGKPVDVPAKRKVVFRVNKALKDAVNS